MTNHSFLLVKQVLLQRDYCSETKFLLISLRKISWSLRNYESLVSTVEIEVTFQLFAIFTKLLVASVLHGHQGQAEVAHAMVLDTYDKVTDMLIFKNTYDDPENGQPKQFEIARTDPNAPEELYFVHIEVKDINNPATKKEKQSILAILTPKRDKKNRYCSIL